MVITMLAGLSTISTGPNIKAFSSSMALRRAPRAAAMFGSVRRSTGVFGSKDGVGRPLASRYESTLAVVSAMMDASTVILLDFFILQIANVMDYRKFQILSEGIYKRKDS